MPRFRLFPWARPPEDGPQNFLHHHRALAGLNLHDGFNNQLFGIFQAVDFQGQFVGNWQRDQVGQNRAVKRSSASRWPLPGRCIGIRQVGQHLHQTDKRADHAKGRGGVADAAKHQFAQFIVLDRFSTSLEMELLITSPLWPSTHMRMPRAMMSLSISTVFPDQAGRFFRTIPPVRWPFHRSTAGLPWDS